MISFACDYSEGAHPAILKRLSETNMEQLPGYGEDKYCVSARERIRQATGCPEADVFFLVGGTQTNATVIDTVLSHYEAVIAADTGHIAVHEGGAVEFCGHKVVTIPGEGGKLSAEALTTFLDHFNADTTRQHCAQPGMVYISFPTELGTLYTRKELTELYEVCKKNNLPLFIDGARLGYGLESPKADIDLPTLATLCDVFYIGGTKVGALCGEAVVFPRGDAPRNMFTIVKQHGALLAKGRLLGIQFDTLFTDGLYFSISRRAIEAAWALRRLFAHKGIELSFDSPTNQQFPILTQAQMEKLRREGIVFETWETLGDGRAVTRFCTSWATPMEHIERLGQLL